MKNMVVEIPPCGWARRRLWWQGGFSDFSLKILWFSLGTFQNSSDEMNGVERLFVGIRGIKGNNSLTSSLMEGFLKILVDNYLEKMESHLLGLTCLITVQGSQWFTQRDVITKWRMLRFSTQTMVLLMISTTTRTGGKWFTQNLTKHQLISHVGPWAAQWTCLPHLLELNGDKLS